MATKHTLEKWRWHDQYCSTCGCGHESLESDKEGILLHNAAWSITSEHKQLIAAAPELLEGCRLAAAVLAEHEQYDGDEPSRESEAADVCHAALAKAEPKAPTGAVLNKVKGTKPEPDLTVNDQGTIILLEPQTDAGRAWIEGNLDSPLQWGNAVAVEHRFIQDIIAGVIRDGLIVEEV